jgi:hypothetical protein
MFGRLGVLNTFNLQCFQLTVGLLRYNPVVNGGTAELFWLLDPQELAAYADMGQGNIVCMNRPVILGGFYQSEWLDQVIFLLGNAAVPCPLYFT